MSRWHNYLDAPGHADIFDPLCVERSAPMDDEEAALVKAICQAATPGPLVLDDDVEGEGAVVVSLPDGRLIVSLTAPVEQAKDDAVAYANAQLICKARYLLLRLLRDRQQWQQQREFLLEKIRTLEVALQPEQDTANGEGGAPISPRPR